MKVLGKLPTFLEALFPQKWKRPKKSTHVVVRPYGSGTLAALRYQLQQPEQGAGSPYWSGHFDSAWVLDKSDPRMVDDHILAVGAPAISKTPMIDQVLPDFDEAYVVLCQLNLNRKFVPIIRQKLPKIKDAAHLGRYYLSAQTVNQRIAQMMTLHALEVFSLSGYGLQRATVPALNMNGYLSGLGFRTFNTHGDRRLYNSFNPTEKELRATLKDYMSINTDYALRGLCVDRNFVIEGKPNNFSLWTP